MTQQRARVETAVTVRAHQTKQVQCCSQVNLSLSSAATHLGPKPQSGLKHSSFFKSTLKSQTQLSVQVPGALIATNESGSNINSSNTDLRGRRATTAEAMVARHKVPTALTTQIALRNAQAPAFRLPMPQAQLPSPSSDACSHSMYLSWDGYCSVAGRWEVFMLSLTTTIASMGLAE
ncbi:hypothetical protein K438DRAFT_1749770 [Mycena galopus ATCC 62051]|nr:hypothetical protein K438DRAFT_1749770 [Mycena galopus ATCC 62051]